MTTSPVAVHRGRQAAMRCGGLALAAARPAQEKAAAVGDSRGR
jgi:hypothetical protein